MNLRRNTLTWPNLFCVCILTCALNGESARVSESRQAFRTYPFSDPDPVARMTNIYPYFRFDGYSAQPITMDWTVVTLENDYIKVLIAPEIGGKILGAFEKATGKPFLYYNQVIKFREIAMRGPWTSGGIEFNFGDIGHTPATATPVKYITRSNDDGSVSCVVGTIDLPSRTEWRVEINLPKDKAYFATRSYWYNPTALPTSLYHWMNAAAAAAPDLRFYYPGNSYIGHDGAACAWPKSAQGKDLALYRDNNFGSYKSYHVLGAYTDWYAAYWQKDDFGVVHWSPYTDKPGKKIWIWGLACEGEAWVNWLTDAELGNGQYVEIQSGLLFNQAIAASSRSPFKHQAFPAYGAERFSDIWYPCGHTGGIVAANTSGALNVTRQGQQLHLAFCPVEAIATEVTLTVAGQIIYKQPLHLQPLQTWQKTVRAPDDTDLTVRIGDRLVYSTASENEKQLQRPLQANADFAWDSLQGFYTQAEELARQRDYTGALGKFQACLAHDRLFTPALIGVAEIYYRQADYPHALAAARQALANDSYDADANFIYGCICRQQGKMYDAMDALGIAARSMKYRSAANVELAEIALGQHASDMVTTYAQQALDYNRFNMAAYKILAVHDRLSRRPDLAGKVQQDILQLDPLNSFALFEHYLLTRKSEDLHALRALHRDELAYESYLELASYYLKLALYDDAEAALDRAPMQPMVRYTLAYILHMQAKPSQSMAMLAVANHASPYLVFPHRAEDEAILLWAERSQPHWKTKYYLALLYWHRGQQALAKQYFSNCAQEPDYAPFYSARGSFFKTLDGAVTRADFSRALQLDASDWRSYRALSDCLAEEHDIDAALAIAQKSIERFPANYQLQFNQARLLLRAKQYAAALSILNAITILPFEGASYGHAAYYRACTMRAAELMAQRQWPQAQTLLAKARLWPERLGAGKPYAVDDRLTDFLDAICQKKMGKIKQAVALFKKVTAGQPATPEPDNGNEVVAALALIELGQSQAGSARLQQWAQRQGDAELAAATAKYIASRNEPDRVTLSGCVARALQDASAFDTNRLLAQEALVLFLTPAQ